LSIYALDLETKCAVEGCKYHGQSLCKEGHSLSPWHSEITVVGIVGIDNQTRKVYRRYGNWSQFLHDLSDGYLKDAEFVCHNGKFDLLHLWVHGLRELFPLSRWLGDTQLMAYVLTEKIPDYWIADYEAKRLARSDKTAHRKGSKHSLKSLAPFFLGVDAFWEVSDHNDDEYVLRDAEYTARLYPILAEKLKGRSEWSFYSEKQLPWTKMLLEAEYDGVVLDGPALAAKEADLRLKSESLKAKLDEQWANAHIAYKNLKYKDAFNKYQEMSLKHGIRLEESPRYLKLFTAAAAKLPAGVDYDSPKQMLWLFRDHLGYDVQTLEGDESTGREVLERLADQGKEDVRTYLEWRKVNKLLTAFIPTYRELATDGRLHPIFNPDVTRTGRLSSERPNCQQVPPELRPLFKAKEGYSFVGYDAAAIEAKLIALYTNDPALYEVIDKGISIHDYNTINFLGLQGSYDEVKSRYPAERAATKNVGFALFYNAGVNRIRIAYAQKGYHLTQAECKRIHERFKKAYSKAYEYAQAIVSHMETGEVFPNLLGRPLRIENPEDAYMKAFNTLIQSSASDLNLEGAYRALNRMRGAGLNARLVLLVHDFTMFEVADEDLEKAQEIIKSSLITFSLSNDLGPIKLTLDGGISKVWNK
jgi:DNA polymerase I-like protein with 3'-5' exonuclease and polymerase domains